MFKSFPLKSVKTRIKLSYLYYPCSKYISIEKNPDNAFSNLFFIDIQEKSMYNYYNEKK